MEAGQIKIFEHFSEGFKVAAEYGEWKVGMLHYNDRFSRLGEMEWKELKETTMDPANRKMKRVQLTDAVEADHIFSTLMGEEVEPRRKFIEENAVYATLDV